MHAFTVWCKQDEDSCPKPAWQVCVLENCGMLGLSTTSAQIAGHSHSR